MVVVKEGFQSDYIQKFTKTTPEYLQVNNKSISTIYSRFRSGISLVCYLLLTAMGFASDKSHR